ncbi:Hypothetical protein RMHFA_04392 [Roseomonas mucosa]|jgi:hypothetical protein|uniref:Uncharacterized protein n=1 Tax=Roseomonas mucosa TaxID=207340 RepID=A0A4Y1N2M9_9PROT|nr:MULTISPECIES: hypothetical protein [Roseomonas]MDT8263585.1 hypothetical protein [Roseomonas sp. DSM 102946]ATR22597.1 hypothetical protein CTJ15_21310 [Roseomonas sp. FDAARGOS_362]AWV24408.1 Hypothetical protein RADP37_04392 [Roseomonas mucosa]MDT8274863.1 hypothetical protein [Roseomonas mucosa]MDT8355526.1 hypothetical protein [Roseomonas mucosa]
MKKILLLGAGLALFGAAGMAIAQTPPPPPGGPQAERPQGAGGPGGPGGPEGGPGPHHGWRGGPPMMRPMGPSPSRAASFRIERNGTEMSIRCAENESTQACVAAASTLIDKFNAANPAR